MGCRAGAVVVGKGVRVSESESERTDDEGYNEIAGEPKSQSKPASKPASQRE